jgi:hypothetical protein
MLLAGLLATASGAGAQAIRGHLIDDSRLEPVGGATITVLIGDSRGAQVRTRDDGSFFIALDAWGAYRLEAERIGFGVTTSQPFQVERGDTVTVDFRILPDAVLLSPILVTARSNRGENVFRRRMDDWGRGIFVTPAMIDSIGPRHPADVLRRQEKIWLSWGWGSSASGMAGPVPNIRSFVGTGCLSFMIDGRPIYRPRWATGSPWMDYPLDMLRGDDLVAVEIYRGISEVPPDIKSAAEEIFNGQAAPGVARLDGSMAERVQQDFIARPCGIVNFWTRAGW